MRCRCHQKEVGPGGSASQRGAGLAPLALGRIRVRRLSPLARPDADTSRANSGLENRSTRPTNGLLAIRVCNFCRINSICNFYDPHAKHSVSPRNEGREVAGGRGGPSAIVVSAASGHLTTGFFGLPTVIKGLRPTPGSTAPVWRASDRHRVRWLSASDGLSLPAPARDRPPAAFTPCPRAVTHGDAKFRPQTANLEQAPRGFDPRTCNHRAVLVATGDVPSCAAVEGKNNSGAVRRG